MPSQIIHDPPVYEQVADQLRGLIESGEYPPGIYLPPVRQLSRQLGISRSSLRKALTVLEVLGLVEVRLGDGVKVRWPPSKINLSEQDEPEGAPHGVINISEPEHKIDLSDSSAETPPIWLLQARRLIEPKAAAMAATNASEGQLAGIQQALACNIAHNRMVSIGSPDNRLLHLRIAEASGNPAYALTVRYLLSPRHGAREGLQGIRSGSDMTLPAKHELSILVEAICDRDADRAQQAMLSHLDSVISAFGSHNVLGSVN